MATHHERTVEQVRARYERDATFLAVLLIGSVARGTPMDGSDVDLVFVVPTAELERRRATGSLSIDASDLAQWPRGHVGGGVADLPFLRAVAERGPEPARFAFTSARALFTREPEIERLLPEIPVYQERERLEKMRSFVSQLPVHLSYLELGALSGNAWLLAQTATELVFFAGRLILAHNRILFGNRKQFMAQLAAAVDKPEGIVERAQELMRTPSRDRARAFHDLVMGFREWPAAPEGPWARFGRDRETSWLTGPPALADS
ncbi:MAG TPA: nucleotidyltransferase domain-containing protein [Candidatus Limnocylindria bacterium]|nr:nucleotidyltransferase domain-containing protein [Candidatus Limnocylindria bacterium]